MRLWRGQLSLKALAPPQSAARPKGAPLYVWSVLLHAWSQGADSERVEARLARRGTRSTRQRFADDNHIPAGRVRPCLHIVQGREVAYGLSVGSWSGRRSTRTAPPGTS